MASGCGIEVASEAELAHALRIVEASTSSSTTSSTTSSSPSSPPPMDASHIVFDSPAKTRAEMALALTHGVTINVDSYDELDTLTHVIAALPTPSTSSTL